MQSRGRVVLATVLIILAVLFSVLVGIVYEDVSAEWRQKKNYELMQNELISSGLVYEQIDVEREIKLLTDKESKRTPTVSLIFRTPHKTVYSSLREVLGSFGMCGTLCISPSSLPGDAGNMTVSEYSTLLEGGYASAILYDGSLPLSEYLSLMKEKTLELEIDFPSVLYVFGVSEEKKTYWMFEYDSEGKPIFTNEINEALESYGIEQVVQETYQTRRVSYVNFYEPLVYCEVGS